MVAFVSTHASLEALAEAAFAEGSSNVRKPVYVIM
jgi:hypothetical protein